MVMALAQLEGPPPPLLPRRLVALRWEHLPVRPRQAQHNPLPLPRRHRDSLTLAHSV